MFPVYLNAGLLRDQANELAECRRIADQLDERLEQLSRQAEAPGDDRTRRLSEKVQVIIEYYRRMTAALEEISALVEEASIRSTQNMQDQADSMLVLLHRLGFDD